MFAHLKKKISKSFSTIFSTSSYNLNQKIKELKFLIENNNEFEALKLFFDLDDENFYIFISLLKNNNYFFDDYMQDIFLNNENNVNPLDNLDSNNSSDIKKKYNSLSSSIDRPTSASSSTLANKQDNLIKQRKSFTFSNKKDKEKEREKEKQSNYFNQLNSPIKLSREININKIFDSNKKKVSSTSSLIYFYTFLFLLIKKKFFFFFKIIFFNYYLIFHNNYYNECNNEESILHVLFSSASTLNSTLDPLDSSSSLQDTSSFDYKEEEIRKNDQRIRILLLILLNFQEIFGYIYTKNSSKLVNTNSFPNEETLSNPIQISSSLTSSSSFNSSTSPQSFITSSSPFISTPFSLSLFTLSSTSLNYHKKLLSFYKTSSSSINFFSVNSLDKDGNSPLHLTSANGLISSSYYLLKKNSILTLINKFNKTACDLADENNHKDLSLILEILSIFYQDDEVNYYYGENDAERQLRESYENFDDSFSYLDGEVDDDDEEDVETEKEIDIESEFNHLSTRNKKESHEPLEDFKEGFIDHLSQEIMKDFDQFENKFIGKEDENIENLKETQENLEIKQDNDDDWLEDPIDSQSLTQFLTRRTKNLIQSNEILSEEFYENDDFLSKFYSIQLKYVENYSQIYKSILKKRENLAKIHQNFYSFQDNFLFINENQENFSRFIDRSLNLLNLTPKYLNYNKFNEKFNENFIKNLKNELLLNNNQNCNYFYYNTINFNEKIFSLYIEKLKKNLINNIIILNFSFSLNFLIFLYSFASNTLIFKEKSSNNLNQFFEYFLNDINQEINDLQLSLIQKNQVLYKNILKILLKLKYDYNLTNLKDFFKLKKYNEYYHDVEIFLINFHFDLKSVLEYYEANPLFLYEKFDFTFIHYDTLKKYYYQLKKERNIGRNISTHLSSSISKPSFDQELSIEGLELYSAQIFDEELDIFNELKVNSEEKFTKCNINLSSSLFNSSPFILPPSVPISSQYECSICYSSLSLPPLSPFTLLSLFFHSNQQFLDITYPNYQNLSNYILSSSFFTKFDEYLEKILENFFLYCSSSHIYCYKCVKNFVIQYKVKELSLYNNILQCLHCKINYNSEFLFFLFFSSSYLLKFFIKYYIKKNYFMLNYLNRMELKKFNDDSDDEIEENSPAPSSEEPLDKSFAVTADIIQESSSNTTYLDPYSTIIKCPCETCDLYLSPIPSSYRGDKANKEKKSSLLNFSSSSIKTKFKKYKINHKETNSNSVSSYYSSFTFPKQVQCMEGHSFCLECRSVGHAPATCSMISEWKKLVKLHDKVLNPEKFHEIDEKERKKKRERKNIDKDKDSEDIKNEPIFDSENCFKFLSDPSILYKEKDIEIDEEKDDEEDIDDKKQLLTVFLYEIMKEQTNYSINNQQDIQKLKKKLEEHNPKYKYFFQSLASVELFEERKEAISNSTAHFSYSLSSSFSDMIYYPSLTLPQTRPSSYNSSSQYSSSSLSLIVAPTSFTSLLTLSLYHTPPPTSINLCQFINLTSMKKKKLSKILLKKNKKQQLAQSSPLLSFSSLESKANNLWIKMNTKPCPNNKCRLSIEKNEGCNHMKCPKCGHEFCWVCMRNWSLHSDNTGGYFQCNKYMEDEAGDGETSNTSLSTSSSPISPSSSSLPTDYLSLFHALLLRQYNNTFKTISLNNFLYNENYFNIMSGSSVLENYQKNEKKKNYKKFFHYFTHFFSHFNSFYYEISIKNENLYRINFALKLSIRGYLLPWFHTKKLNPVVEEELNKIQLINFDKNEENMNHNKKIKENTSNLDTSNLNRNKNYKKNNKKLINAILDNLNFSSSNLLSSLQFFTEAYQELIKSRQLLQFSYIFSFYEFNLISNIKNFLTNYHEISLNVPSSSSSSSSSNYQNYLKRKKNLYFYIENSTYFHKNSSFFYKKLLKYYNNLINFQISYEYSLSQYELLIENLSNMIAKKKIRSNFQEISFIIIEVLIKKNEFLSLIYQYYNLKNNFNFEMKLFWEKKSGNKRNTTSTSSSTSSYRHPTIEDKKSFLRQFANNNSSISLEVLEALMNQEDFLALQEVMEPEDFINSFLAYQQISESNINRDSSRTDDLFSLRAPDLPPPPTSTETYNSANSSSNNQFNSFQEINGDDMIDLEDLILNDNEEQSENNDKSDDLSSINVDDFGFRTSGSNNKSDSDSDSDSESEEEAPVRVINRRRSTNRRPQGLSINSPSRFRQSSFQGASDISTSNFSENSTNNHINYPSDNPSLFQETEPFSENLEILSSMGFALEDSKRALKVYNNDLELAINSILNN